MPLSEQSLKNRIKSGYQDYWQSQGYNSNQVFQDQEFDVMVEILARAVIDEITQNAQVAVTGGSSSGVYSVK